MLNINHLRSFYVCALHKNVTRAAEELEVSQPSVSQQIKAFEEEIGFALFFRNGRTLELTAEGKSLFAKSKSIFESLIGIQEFIEHRTEFNGSVNFCVSEEIERPFVAKIASQLIKSAIFQDAKFSITSWTDEDSNQRNKGKDQIVLSHKPISTLELVQEFSFPVKLISKKQNIEISQAKQDNIQSLIAALGQKVILPAKSHSLRSEIDKHVGAKELSHQTLMESNILACLTEAVREEAGCSLLPIPYVHDDIKRNKLSVYGPAQGFWKHKIYLYAGNDADESVTKEIRRIIQRFTVENGG